MERKKIITVAILAVGIVGWRMSAMKRASEEMGPVVENTRKKYAPSGAQRQEVIPAGMIRLTFSDHKVLDVPLNKARLFDYFDAIFSQGWKEAQERKLTLLDMSSTRFQELLKDLDWVERVQSQRRQTETEEQAARRVVKTMAGVSFNRGKFESLIAQLQAADYLRQRSLTELYSRQIADMILADESMRLLAEGNGEYYALITNLFSYFKNNIVQYMPRAAVALGEYTFRQNAMVRSVAISADGNRVVTGSDDNTAKIIVWNGNAWVEQYTIAHNKTVSSVAISADGNRVVTGSRDNTANIVTWNGNVWVEQYTIGHTDMVNSVAISADGNRVVTGSDDNTAKIVAWNGNAWVEQRTIRHNGSVVSVAISADGNRVVTGSMDKTAKIFGWNGNEWIMQYSARHNDRVRSVAISADGTRVVTGAQDGGVMILAWNPGDPNPTTVAWNANELGKQLHAYQCAKDRSVTDADIYWWVVVAISADGNKVVIGSCFHENSIVVWNGDKWIKQYSSSNNRPPAVAISADGTRVVMTPEDNTAKIVGSNGDAWDEQYTIAHNRSVRSVAISADGNRVVTGSQDNSCKIVMFLSTSLPGISDFEGCLFEHLLKWAKTNNQKISKSGWTGDILRRITWRDVEPVAKNGLQGLIRETMQHGVMQ